MEKHLDIRHNKGLNRWELHFVKTPDEDLSNYLERLGYRYHPKKPRLYFAPHHDAYNFFANDLKEVLEKDLDYRDIMVRPSHIPHESNIIHNKFSYVTISYRKGKSVGKKNFVVFDQYKRIAEAIAQQYGVRVYKDRFVSVEAAPRMQKKKARDLLAANLVIPTQEEVVKTPTKEISPLSKSETTIQSLTNSRGVYTQENSGDRYEQLEVPIPKQVNYEVTIAVVKDENDQYRFGTSILKNFGDHSSTSSPVSQTGESYSTKKEALQIAFRQVISRIKSQLATRDYIISDQDKKNRALEKALHATVTFAKEFGVVIEQEAKEKEDVTRENEKGSEKKNAPKTKKQTPTRAKSNRNNIAPEKVKDTPKGQTKDDKPNLPFKAVQNGSPTQALEVSSEKLSATIPNADKKPMAIEVKSATEVSATSILQAIAPEESERIRRQFKAQGFTVAYTGKQAFTKNIALSELAVRQGYNQLKLDTKLEKEFQQWIAILEKEVTALDGKEDVQSKQSKMHRLERIAALEREAEDLTTLVEEEDQVFRQELFGAILERVQTQGHTLSEDKLSGFRNYMMKSLFKGTLLETSPDMPIGKTVRILIDNYFPKEKENSNGDGDPDYMDKVIAIMHDHYMQARRLSRKKVEEIKDLANVPNLGMLWEAVELSWLLWYKFYYQEPVAFENRLKAMIRYWNEVQPSYDYSDSSKELYKQYSTPCPIGAMIAEYTGMVGAQRIFEPSAGNGLLVLGADPAKTHVNEIDKNRRSSLEKQGFHTITHFNAAEPFPEDLTQSFDVMVTNPPFATWDADDFDKKRIVRKYFNKYRRLDKNRLRLEHVMSGLALHTLKDSGKAALILMGHLYFDDQGFIAKARPFFNWLYMHYRVDDVINLNGFTLYNKQGATPKTMLVLISGRKHNPSNTSIAPTRKQAGSLDVVVDTFEALWERIKSSIKTPLALLIEKLKIETDDIL
ncbi:MAG: hypothetical protein CL613_11310 [Aquimarina sp.]|nr:hypothetical protein [Aquimarina sp.]